MRRQSRRAGTSRGSSAGKRLYRILCPMDFVPALCCPLLRKQALLLPVGGGGHVLPTAGSDPHAPVHHLPPCCHRRISREVLPGHPAAGCQPVPGVSDLKKAGVTAGPIPSFHDEALESSNVAIFHQKTASSKIIQSTGTVRRPMPFHGSISYLLNLSGPCLPAQIFSLYKS